VTSTWYPPTTYEPAAGTGQLLVNPPFAAMTPPRFKRDLIETGGTIRQTPPAFYINDRGGCIGRFWWVNTIPFPGGEWSIELFPIWGCSQWYRP
jgi:hypothetical protein